MKKVLLASFSFRVTRGGTKVINGHRYVWAQLPREQACDILHTLVDLLARPEKKKQP